MENENKNCGHGGGCGKVLGIVAIIISVVSIGISAFTLGTTIKNNKDAAIINCPTTNTCPMQGNCPMQDYMQRGVRNRNDFMPIWSMFDKTNRTNNFSKNNTSTASSSNAKKKKIGGYSPYNKVYDKKPIQDIEGEQSPQEYKTYEAPDNTYGEKVRERERLKKEKKESIATRETTDTY